MAAVTEDVSNRLCDWLSAAWILAAVVLFVAMPLIAASAGAEAAGRVESAGRIAYAIAFGVCLLRLAAGAVRRAAQTRSARNDY